MITSPLYDPAHGGDVEKVRAHLDAHPEDLNSFISDGYSLLHIACSFGHEKLVAFLLDRRALVNLNADNRSKTTPLHLAVSFRDEAIALRLTHLLMANGAELNAQQAGGQTALHHAVGRGSAELAKVLIDAGADPFLKDELGRSAMDVAKDVGNADLQAVLKAVFH